MNETLQNWLNNGWLIEHQTSRQEVAGSVSDQEVAEMIDLAQQLDQRIKTWLKVNFPDLVP